METCTGHSSLRCLVAQCWMHCKIRMAMAVILFNFAIECSLQTVECRRCIPKSQRTDWSEWSSWIKQPSQPAQTHSIAITTAKHCAHTFANHTKLGHATQCIRNIRRKQHQHRKQKAKLKNTIERLRRPLNCQRPPKGTGPLIRLSSWR